MFMLMLMLCRCVLMEARWNKVLYAAVAALPNLGRKGNLHVIQDVQIISMSTYGCLRLLWSEVELPFQELHPNLEVSS